MKKQLLNSGTISAPNDLPRIPSLAALFLRRICTRPARTRRMALCILVLLLGVIGSADKLAASNCVLYEFGFGAVVGGSGLGSTTYCAVGKVGASGSIPGSSASSNLATLTQTVNVGANGLGAGFYTAAAEFGDTLTFSGASPGATGTFTLTTKTQFSYGSGAYEFLGVDVAQKLYGQGWTYNPLRGWLNPLVVTFPLINGLPTGVGAQIYASIPANGNATYVSDPLTLTLPSGVTYTTASGLHEFHSGTGTPTSTPTTTPEPSSLLLLGSGILGAGGFLRKRMLS